MKLTKITAAAVTALTVAGAVASTGTALASVPSTPTVPQGVTANGNQDSQTYFTKWVLVQSDGKTPVDTSKLTPAQLKAGLETQGWMVVDPSDNQDPTSGATTGGPLHTGNTGLDQKISSVTDQGKLGDMKNIDENMFLGNLAGLAPVYRMYNPNTGGTSTLTMNLKH